MQAGRSGLGWRDGLASFVGGISFVARTPSVWFYALVPALMALLMALLFGCLFSALSAWGASKVDLSWLTEKDTGWETVARWAAIVSAVVMALLASAFAGLALAQPLSGWALEAIARKQEEALTGRTPPDLPFLTTLGISIRCTLFMLVAGITIIGALFVVGLLLPPLVVITVPLKVLVVAWLLAWDFLDYPLGIHGQGIRKRAAWVSANRYAVTAFGIAWTLVLLIPFVGLLVLPLGVAGATRLMVAARGDGVEADQLEILEAGESSG